MDGLRSYSGYIHVLFSDSVLSLSNAIFFISVFAEQDNRITLTEIENVSLDLR